jgi:hypothetical protein
MDENEKLNLMADMIAQRQRQQQIEELRKLNGTQSKSTSVGDTAETVILWLVIGMMVVVGITAYISHN